MNRIISKKSLSDDLIRFEISTFIPVKDIQAGHYLAFRTERNSPRIPLPVVKSDAEKGTVTVIASTLDERTASFAGLNAGTVLNAIEGPYGYPARVENFGTVVCIGRESGMIGLLPVLSALRAAGNRVITLLSASSARGLRLQDEIKALSDEMIVLTDDGSEGEKGGICHAAVQVMRNNPVNQVFVFGGARIIRETCSLTTKYQLPLQAVMYLGKALRNGTHGIFRVSIGGNARSICVDGFDFNAYYPNFEELIKRFESEEADLGTLGKELETANSRS